MSIGVTEHKSKELVTVEDNYQKLEANLGLNFSMAYERAPALTVSPRLAMGNSALGFWNAMAKIFSDTR
ncbi:MAG: hypothetical protein ACTS73_07285 [Arsenophonus sp. NEOnobi-MAG3]